MIEHLSDGRKVIALSENVKACLLVTVGDTDKDGAMGLRAQVLADVPFDGQDAKPLFDTGEIEAMPPEMVPDSLKEALEEVKGKFGFLKGILDGFLK